MFDEKIKLYNGIEIPQLALGTWLIEDDVVADAVKSALEVGYTHIDTAQAYGNERGVGEAIRNSGLDRNELFITSKVAAEIKNYDEAKASIETSLEKLNIDYIDMMLIIRIKPCHVYLTIGKISYHYVFSTIIKERLIQNFIYRFAIHPICHQARIMSNKVFVSLREQRISSSAFLYIPMI